MPWHTTADVRRHNKRVAKDPAKARKWRSMANALLREGHSEASAIRIANAHFEEGRGKKLYDGKDRK